ncbi:4-hydroxybenzoate octaprenyltransferase [Terrihabitans soli]|uniref:4-hydroxybenzoate octaprenyltransferase n=1 Tax=Terrihabitans soli TaxID=708113 RepID=A0A6S6QVS5_9HYPH|nr:4-hydroxybenzoate octaprenyltransferase [Terrihabitans soli]BCJ91675.1 4-hydroxybenzoate octaprenyltransferase [Terrihabitans soli]
MVTSSSDAPPGNWVDRHAPDWLKPFARLARWDRPIGVWLLFWPCAWSTALVATATGKPAPDLFHLVLFLIGAFVMRGAGCTWNDIVDRDIDAKIARTASRPLPSGQITTKAAAGFLVLQLVVALVVLRQFNLITMALGFLAIFPVVTYPFMKRITWWPQAVLGICFGWGALMGWAAAEATVPGTPSLLLFLGCVFWIIGYDTIYALQDIEDDALAGVRSTARLFGAKVKPWLWGFYGGTVILIAGALIAANAGFAAWLGLFAFSAHLVWQVRVLDPQDPKHALMLFRSNRTAGLILFAGFVADAALRAL